MPDKITLKGEYADVNKVRLHYVATGEGRLILFIHGFPEFWYAWKAQLEYFGQNYQAVDVDMRGYNLSSKPDGVENYRIPDLVEDIRALGEHLSSEKFILVAHDWGGVAAWAFAHQHPECLEKLVIINAPHPTVFADLLKEDPEQQAASQYILVFRSNEAEGLLSADNYAALLQAVSSGTEGYEMSDEDKQKYIEAWSQPGALTGGLNYYRAAGFAPPPAGKEASAEIPAEDRMERQDIMVPTLVIWGEMDTALRPGNLDGLDEYVPDLEIARIPEGSHWVVREQPDRVNSLIEKFINK